MAKIALKKDDIILGYYAGDDTDIVTNAVDGITYENVEEANAEIAIINKVWRLAVGEFFVAV